MGKKKGKKGNGKPVPVSRPIEKKESASRLHPETKNSIWAVAFIGLGVIFVLAGLAAAGPAGAWLYRIFGNLFGWGYVLLPAILFLVAATLLFSGRKEVVGIKLLGASLLVLSALGLIELYAPTHGGWLGRIFAAVRIPFGQTGAVIINTAVLIISGLIVVNSPLRIPSLFGRTKKGEGQTTASEAPEVPIIDPLIVPERGGATQEEAKKEDAKQPEQEEEIVIAVSNMNNVPKHKGGQPRTIANYVPPPLDLLKSAVEKPTTGDLRANANIIKRTLESFGIAVEMGEINIGPKVTRYTLKPAEGMKLSRITALSQDLALNLAAHPIRIEAPIPGKSLVGVEVPNKAAAIVRLGNLLSYPDFQASGPLGVVLGRDVNGDPIFANIAKMPHLLIAGATGSGKSIFVHSLLVSLLYKNSPNMLRLALVDPKRVELSMYNNLPHLITPVITENKKAMGVFRWALKEMERRYELLSAEGRRDIQSYNAKNEEDQLPYVVIVIDELADLMATYGREVEGAIIRLAQMARATGIHLILSTQRPSVEVITGLIKANITNRVALQVASQIDSRTILDTSGAEKLLGGGDLLFLSPELSKPKRIQGAYLTEDEIDKVSTFIKEHNQPMPEGDEGQLVFGDEKKEDGNAPSDMLDEYLEDGEDELYDEAVAVIGSARKASASLLQRRLKVGYARAARLLDLMENNGLIGPGDGAKPREVFLDRVAHELEK